MLSSFDPSQNPGCVYTLAASWHGIVLWWVMLVHTSVAPPDFVGRDQIRSRRMEHAAARLSVKGPLSRTGSRPNTDRIRVTKAAAFRSSSGCGPAAASPAAVAASPLAAAWLLALAVAAACLAARYWFVALMRLERTSSAAAVLMLSSKAS